MQDLKIANQIEKVEVTNYTMFQKSSPFWSSLYRSQMLTNFNSIWWGCSWGN